MQSHSHNNFVRTESKVYNQWEVLSVAKSQSRCQMIITVLDNVQSKQIYGMNLLVQITFYQREPQFLRLPKRTLIGKIIYYFLIFLVLTRKISFSVRY